MARTTCPTSMADIPHWEEHYRSGHPPWDTGRASSELIRIVEEERIDPCRAIELGCGTGTNAVWLAERGFEVSAVDLVPLAIEKAIDRAAKAGVKVQFLSLNLLELPDLGEPFDFLTWFEYAPEHADAFEELVRRLRSTAEWRYVEREVDIRASR